MRSRLLTTAVIRLETNACGERKTSMGRLQRGDEVALFAFNQDEAVDFVDSLIAALLNTERRSLTGSCLALRRKSGIAAGRER